MAAAQNKSLDDLIEKLGVDFNDKSLLDIALHHRSYSFQHNILQDNERLEFLGDSILNACVSALLFNKFPNYNEGELTKIKAQLVSGDTLRRWGEELEIKYFIFLGEKIKQYVLQKKTQVIENAMEAIIGAIYLDSGFDVTYKFIKKFMETQEFHKIVDFKSTFQEYTVGRFSKLPEYNMLSEQGPQHKKKFKISVSVNGKIYGKGEGYSKKVAEQQAAESAYEKMKGKKI